MADLAPLGFNPDNVEHMDTFEVIPPGSYPVVIVESDVKDTKEKTGKILELKYQIIEGPHTSKTLIDRLNIINKSDVAQKIGQSQLKDICEAIGFKGQLTNSEALHGKPFSVSVEVETFKSNKNDKNLQSNKIAKRMTRQAAQTAPLPDVSAQTSAAKTAAAASKW